MFYSPRSILLSITLTLFISACVPPLPELPPHVGDSYPDTLGPWAVGHDSYTVVDANRENRPLLLDIWYPVDAEDATHGVRTTYALLGALGIESDVAIENAVVSSVAGRKLIIFSHGFNGTNTQSTPLMETLASHGFIVVSPEHTGNAQSSPTDSWEVAATRRVPDVSFVIDSLLARNSNPGDPFYQRIDSQGIGVTGHSFGGATSMGMIVGWAGADLDTRVTAVAPISGEIGLFENLLADIDKPVMLIGGTLDESVPTTHNDLGLNLIPSPVYQADIIGATHTHFANVCAIGEFLINDMNISMTNWEAIGAADLTAPYLQTCSGSAFPINEAIRLQNLYVVSFFKKHLLETSDYDQYLTINYAQNNEPNIAFDTK